LEKGLKNIRWNLFWLLFYYQKKGVQVEQERLSRRRNELLEASNNSSEKNLKHSVEEKRGDCQDGLQTFYAGVHI
jgi:hypothetical protein